MQRYLDRVWELEKSQAELSSEARDALAADLGRLQRAARVANVPLIVVFEGWEASGKGTAINALLMALDPRGCLVRTIQAPNEDDRLRPPLYRFWRSLPEAGRMTIFDRSWYDAIWEQRVRGQLQKAHWNRAIEDVMAFERMLVRGGAVLLKVFLHISEKEQARRFKKLRANRDTAWRIDRRDVRQHRHYRDWATAIGDTIQRTNTPDCPWLVVPAHDKGRVEGMVFEELVASWARRLDGPVTPAPAPARESPILSRVTEGVSPLDRVDCSCSLERAEYEQRTTVLKKELRCLEHRMYRERVAAVIVFEGWDAAGKGGAIRRLVSGLDPRGYEVVPVAAPNDIERRQHYLWRFWTRMPKDGHITVFDRSWYGRVLVERVEGFCSNAEWLRAYDEIAALERSLTDHGTIVIKFWMQIDADEQLRRFEARTNTPEKRWKITDEDWRNRAKRVEYEAAVADMITRTSTSDAPWTIVPSNDKLCARVFVMQTVADALQRGLG